MSRPTVLIVDDSPAIRHALRKSLSADWDVIGEAANGEEALDLCRVHPPPDLMLLDLDMPVMDGLTCLRALRADPRLTSVDVIICTTVNNEEIARAALSIGAVSYVTKPVSGAKLTGTLLEALARSGKPVDRAAIAENERPHLDEGLRLFLGESRENLEKLEQQIVELEGDPENQNLLDSIFRTIHTIKGMCGFLELRRLEIVSHVAEDVLMRLREGTLDVTREATTAILMAVDTIKAILDSVESCGAEGVGNDEAVLSALKTVVAAPQSAPHPKPTESDEAELSANSRTPAGNAASQTLRVDIAVLNGLMARVEELVIARNRLIQLVQGEETSAYRSPVQELNRVTTRLQEVVTKARLQDIGHAWRRLPRVLRDLTAASGKEIDLVLEGTDTQVDRQVLDAIEEPFVHMLRNSSDHGIEDVATRRAQGKPQRGTIHIRASQEGSNIVVELADDGRGIDSGAVRARLVNEGRLTSESTALTEDELLAHVFEPGFSTASKVTSVSGRGVGMDIVRSKIQSIGGSVSIQSRPGLGTTIRIKIPLTLAITPALIISSGGLIFALPQGCVRELVRIHEENRDLIEALRDSAVLRIRGELLTLIRLDEVLELKPIPNREEHCVVVVQVDGFEFGMLVDSVLNTEEVVIKPVGSMVSRLREYGGTTILGDGRIILILDPMGMARRARAGADSVRRAHAPVATPAAADQQLEDVPLLLFQAGPSSRQAVPLALVSRLELIPADRIEMAADRHVVQYRGALLPLVPAHPTVRVGAVDPQPIVVFSDGHRSMVLMVDLIRDIVQQPLQFESRSGRPGILGTAVVEDAATEIIDIHHFLKQARDDWFVESDGARRTARLLIIDDSDFFRNMLVPLLTGQGHSVSQATDGGAALQQLENGDQFDVILCDIAMPHLDGFEFAQRLQGHPDHSQIPLIALTARSSPKDREQALGLGFFDYLHKFDRDALLGSVRRACERGLREATS